MGISMADLDLLDVGMLIDMFIESGNDDVEWYAKPTQEDFDKF